MQYGKRITKGITEIVIAAGITYGALGHNEKVTEFYRDNIPNERYALTAIISTYISTMVAAGLIAGKGFRDIADDYEKD